MPLYEIYLEKVVATTIKVEADSKANAEDAVEKKVCEDPEYYGFEMHGTRQVL